MRRAVQAALGATLLLDLVVSGTSLGASLSRSESTSEIFSGQTRDPYVIAVRAYVWGYPLVEAARIRWKRTANEGAINVMRHERKLSDPSRRTGVGPNNDTLYSTAWLDLAAGPVELRTPDFGSRYYTFQFGQADSSTQESLGVRTHGGQLPPVLIVGPNYRGSVPAGMHVVTSMNRYLLIAGRILVRGPGDYATVHALQDRIKLSPLAVSVDRVELTHSTSGLLAVDSSGNGGDPGWLFLRDLGAVLRDWTVSDRDAQLIRSFKTIGLTQNDGFRPDSLSANFKSEVARGCKDAANIVQRKSLNLGVNMNGWTTNMQGSRFGDDYLLRAGVAKDQIFVTVPEEAIYPVGRVDSDGYPLHGKRHYRIRMSADQLPPINAFWSITAYDDRGFLTENPISRYSVGDRTPGLIIGHDGSVEIELMHRAPLDREHVNWLPVPEGPFYLMMRLYLPGPSVFDRTWAPPRIQRIE